MIKFFHLEGGALLKIDVHVPKLVEFISELHAHVVLIVQSVLDFLELFNQFLVEFAITAV